MLINDQCARTRLLLLLLLRDRNSKFATVLSLSPLGIGRSPVPPEILLSAARIAVGPGIGCYFLQ